MGIIIKISVSNNEIEFDISTNYQNIPLNCGRSYVTYLFIAGLNVFLSPDKSLIVFGKWL